MAGVPGQGRRFLASDALDAATLVFWKHGYEGASLKRLTGAMGINPPSMYKAFGSKEELFFAAVEHYRTSYGMFFDEALTEKSSVRIMERILHGAADHYTNPKFPGGCLLLNGAVTVSPENGQVAERLGALRQANVRQIADALKASPVRGRHSDTVPATTVAAFIGATMQGMSQSARDGATADDLHAIADLALDSLRTPSA